MAKLGRHATLRQLQVFEAIGRLKSFSRAAEELFLTQSTVSTQIKNLTDIVGTPLVEYIGRRVYLTQAGTALYTACRGIFDHLDNAERHISDLQSLKAGSLSVAAITTAQYIVPEMLGRFSQRYPDVGVALHIHNREQVLERLYNNEDDVYILGHNPPSELDLHVEPFAPNPLYFMAARDHPLAQARRRLTLRDIADQPLIQREPGSGIRAAVEGVFNAQGLEPHVRMVFSSSGAIKHALIGQLGVAVLSLHTILSDGIHGPLAVLDVENFPILRKWHVVRHKNKELSVTTQTFLDFLQQEGRALSTRLDQLVAALQNEHALTHHGDIKQDIAD